MGKSKDCEGIIIQTYKVYTNIKIEVFIYRFIYKYYFRKIMKIKKKI